MFLSHNEARKGNLIMNPQKEIATLAGGCFWCMEAIFDQLKGVESVESGYTGGQVANPTYRQVCAETTGHAEAVQITFDPAQITYKDLLNIYFSVHDPTTLNRQGNDVGTSYRSAIFYHSDEQKACVEEVIRELTAQQLWDAPIVTQVSRFDKFYIAEDYHQEYFANNGNQPYCRAVVAPKVAKFRSHYFERLKK
jgi:peptide-methionine (S)-S-oxide reductase